MATPHPAVVIFLGAAAAALVAIAYVMITRPTAVAAGAPPRRPPPQRPLVPSPLDVRVSRGQPAAPERPYVPTRARTDFHQVGFVYDVDPAKKVRAPLYGRPAPRNPSRWQYFVRTADDADVRIGARVGGKDCLDDLGCGELQTGDELRVPELSTDGLKVSVYSTNGFAL